MGFGVGVFAGFLVGVGVCAACLLWVDGMIPEVCASIARRVRGE